ncbi:MAG: acyl-CoA dehydrogenase family protein [Firmicutes bacterium]|nr:acyl-CoA dehydrogenase family protein [Bacillota bacterium]
MGSRFFTAEHEALRERIRGFVRAELAPHVDEWEAREQFPREIFKRMGELGLLGLRYPEEYGGQGRDYFAAVVLSEELARCGIGGLPMAVAVHAEMATPPIFQFGTEEQKQRYLAPAIRGEKVACLGITEPNAGSDVAAIQTTARSDSQPIASKDGAGWVINGRKIFITNGIQADFITLLARTESAGTDLARTDKQKSYDGLSLFLVDKGTPGFEVARKVEKVGMRSSDTAELVFEDCRVPGDALLGQQGRGFHQIMWELQGERLIAAAGAVATAGHILELTVKYVGERQRSGGRLVLSQTAAHTLAEMATRIEAARQLTYATAWKFANNLYPVKEISMAKLIAARTAFWVADRALEIHGGDGCPKGHPIERFWRDTRLNRIAGGTDEIMLEIISRELELR